MIENMSAGDGLRYMGTDAKKWAEEFAAVVRAQGKLPDVRMSRLQAATDPTPGNLLHGWFCNAIEAGRSEGYAEGLRMGTLTQRLRFKAWVMTEPARGWRRRKDAALGFALAKTMPSWLRRYVIVQVTNEAVNAAIMDGRRPDGYAGPEGLGYREMYHAAERTAVPIEVVEEVYCQACQLSHQPPVAVAFADVCPGGMGSLRRASGEVYSKGERIG